MTGSHFDKLLAVLDRQSDERMHPNLLLGYLGMINLMSIMSVVHGPMESESGGIQLPSNVELPKSLADENNLKNTISALMSSAGTNSGVPDLSNLLGMVGGNKKINPQLMLTLMNLLNSMKKNEGGGEANSLQVENGEEKEAVKPNRTDSKNERKRMF